LINKILLLSMLQMYFDSKIIYSNNEKKRF
jgi:hypothetical protein